MERPIFTLSFILAGTTEKLLQFKMQMKPICYKITEVKTSRYNKNVSTSRPFKAKKMLQCGFPLITAKKSLQCWFFQSLLVIIIKNNLQCHFVKSLPLYDVLHVNKDPRQECPEKEGANTSLSLIYMGVQSLSNIDI